MGSYDLRGTEWLLIDVPPPDGCGIPVGMSSFLPGPQRQAHVWGSWLPFLMTVEPRSPGDVASSAPAAVAVGRLDLLWEASSGKGEGELFVSNELTFKGFEMAIRPYKDSTFFKPTALEIC